MSMNGVKKNQSGRGNGASVTVRYALDLAKPSEEGYEYEYSYEQLLEDKLDVKKVREILILSGMGITAVGFRTKKIVKSFSQFQVFVMVAIFI